MSYMELLREHARPEPRLRRLLGHVGIYEIASRFYRERIQESVSELGGEEERTGEDERGGDKSRHRRPVRTSPNKAQRVRTFSEYQATIRSNLEHQRLCDVPPTADTEDGNESGESENSDDSDDSDESDESEESEASESGNDDHAVSILVESAVSERVEIFTRALSSRKSDNLTKKMSRVTITKGEQENDGQLSQQQPRLLTRSQSERAFYNVWL
jgi:hypothetical protein